MAVLHRFPEGMHQEACLLLDQVRRIFPRVIFWIDPDPIFRKPKPGEPFVRRALFALVPPNVPPVDLSPVTAIFEVAHERFLWRRHARELRAVLDAVNPLVYRAAKERDEGTSDAKTLSFLMGKITHIVNSNSDKLEKMSEELKFLQDLSHSPIPSGDDTPLA